mgnify:CR=1 FL=1
MLERFSSQGEQAWLGAYDRVSTVVLPELHSDEPPTLDRSPSQIFNSFDTSEFERRAEQAKALLQRCGLNFEAAMDMNTPRGHTPRAHPRFAAESDLPAERAAQAPPAQHAGCQHRRAARRPTLGRRIDRAELAAGTSTKPT